MASPFPVETLVDISGVPVMPCDRPAGEAVGLFAAASVVDNQWNA